MALVVISNNQKSALFEQNNLVTLGDLTNGFKRVRQEFEIRNQNLDDFAPCLD